MIRRERDVAGRLVVLNADHIATLQEVAPEFNVYLKDGKPSPCCEVQMVNGRYFVLWGTLDEVEARLFSAA